METLNAELLASSQLAAETGGKLTAALIETSNKEQQLYVSRLLSVDINNYSSVQLPLIKLKQKTFTVYRAM